MGMKNLIGSLALVIGLLTAQVGMAQAPAGAPAGSTGLCNDGTYFKGSIKIGACSGHKGLKTWWGVPPKSAKPAAAAESKAAPAPAAAAVPKPAGNASATPPAASSMPAPAATAKASTMAPAPGGGADKVWVNTGTNVYHCPGTTYYGKTKAGSYMSEADAKAKGARPANGKPCK